MYIWFTPKTFYMILIGFGIAFVYAMIAFGILSPLGTPDEIGSAFSPFWLFSFGFILWMVDSWWRLSDPKAETFLIIAGLRFWEILIMAGGLVAVVVAAAQQGLTKPFLISLLITFISSAIFYGAFFWRRMAMQRRITKK